MICLTEQQGVGIMLLRFRFKNFKSFLGETILDLTATSIKEHTSSLINVNGNNILPVAAVFGANASGKSNLFYAFEAMCLDVATQFKKDDKHTSIIPYQFNNSHCNEPSEFEVCVNIDDREYRYGFLRDQNIVIEEWLFEKKFSKNTRSKEKCVYYRNSSLKKLRMDKQSEKEKKEIEYVYSMTENSNLLLTGIGSRGKSKYVEIYNWFSVITDRVNFSNDYDELFNAKINASFLYRNEHLLDDVIMLLREFDDSILKLLIEKEKDNELNDRYVVYSIHACEGSEPIKIPFESESGGTKKIFALACTLFFAISIGVVLFIDELDSKLHPLVLRYIIKMFTNKEKNTGGGQLIFSSHNLVCLDSSDLRRDEIWFVEKNNQVSTLYSLYDFKEQDCNIRSDLSFGKHYLSGRFGAIPFQNQE